MEHLLCLLHQLVHLVANSSLKSQERAFVLIGVVCFDLWCRSSGFGGDFFAALPELAQKYVKAFP